MSSETKPETKKHLNPLLKLAIDIGPLVVFFLANAQGGIYQATAAFMVAIAASLSINYVLLKRIPILPLVTGAFVLVFGGLTLALHDELFIKLKPTIVNGLFAAILFAGLALGKTLLKNLLDTMLDLTDEGWRVLTVRWACYFVFLALLNEIVWRNFSTDVWVSFKLFGIMPLTLVFSIAQLRLLNRYAVRRPEG